ncbi:MAG: methyltransferase domain-containing protein [Nanoarchaeota archaeon]|nr:methyltransferase domain-containing protein [Nanoarchaeota archaeon]
MNLKESLKGKFSQKEIDHMPRAFDIIGNIAIIEISSSLKKKEKIIAQTLLNNNKGVKTVLNKSSRFKGRLRTRKLRFIAGIKTKETEYRENGCVFRFNVETSYFSPRLSSDRLEIAKKVKKGENVLVMFSGVSPYPIVIAKNSKAKEVYAIELNRTASKYALKNIELNKLQNVNIIQGDVRKKIPELKKKKIIFDRIIMARPQLKDSFLEDAKKVSKQGTIIHFHDFLSEEEMPHVAIEKIKKVFNAKILGWKKIGDIGVRRYRIRVDFRVL